MIYYEGGTRPNGACLWCSNESTQVVHFGRCPNVRAIEYYDNGTIKRVEFVEGLHISFHDTVHRSATT